MLPVGGTLVPVICIVWCCKGYGIFWSLCLFEMLNFKGDETLNNCSSLQLTSALFDNC